MSTIQEFLQAVKEIDTVIEQIKENKNNMEIHLKTKQTSILSADEEEVLEKEIEIISEQVQEYSAKAKDDLRAFQAETARMAEKNDNVGTIKLRETHALRMGKEFMAALREFQNLQSMFCEREKERLKESLLVVKPDATDEELEMVSNKDQGGKLLDSVYSLGSYSAKKSWNEASRREKYLDRIYKTAKSIVQMIEEVNAITHKQRASVEKISLHMTEADVHAQEATRQLESALAYEKKVKWIKRILFGILIIIIIVVVLIVFGRLIPPLWGGGSRGGNRN